MALLRERVPFYEKDRVHAPDIAAAKELVQSGVLGSLLGGGVESRVRSDE